MIIGLRDSRLNDRCKECKCIDQLEWEKTWCKKYQENIHYCIDTCIQKHPNCPRDSTEIKRIIHDYNKEE